MNRDPRTTPLAILTCTVLCWLLFGGFHAQHRLDALEAQAVPPEPCGLEHLTTPEPPPTSGAITVIGDGGLFTAVGPGCTCTFKESIYSEVVCAVDHGGEPCEGYPTWILDNSQCPMHKEAFQIMGDGTTVTAISVYPEGGTP